WSNTLQAPKLNPFPNDRSVVILDNCAIHHDEEVRQIIEARLLYLPPYSPDFNPIEQSFKWMKSFLRRHERRAVDPAAREALLVEAMSSISEDLADSWFRNCGY
ncbi:hypothetical protein EXIGLDRAFT_585406, partial [Exidia glandulosa HHB12029]